MDSDKKILLCTTYKRHKDDLYDYFGSNTANSINKCWNMPDPYTWCASRCMAKYGGEFGTDYPDSCPTDCLNNDYNSLLRSNGCKTRNYSNSSGPSRVIAE